MSAFERLTVFSCFLSSFVAEYATGFSRDKRMISRFAIRKFWKAFAAASVILLLISPALLGQQKVQDRRKYLSADTPTSDDPRRVPVPPGPHGPEGTLVLRGGRIFDSTGAPAREGTLVIQRNKILKLLPPDSTDWPAGARILEVSGKTILPGLIDLHMHLTYPASSADIANAMSDADSALRAAEKLRFFLECGITSIRDVGSKGDVPFRLKE